MGRDLIGDDIPPDEVNIVEEGNNYGWPLCYGKNVLDTDFHADDHVVVDGTTRKNTARYFNHSCKPNCFVEIADKRIFVYTRRKILPGEELTYHYGKEYWEDIITPKACKCDFCKEKRRLKRKR